jgi:COP9 signalosome complex subunit 5
MAGRQSEVARKTFEMEN